MTAHRLRRELVVAALGLLVALTVVVYATVMVDSQARGTDLKTFYAAGDVVAHGGNPYDLALVVRSERRLYRMSAEQAGWSAQNPFVQGPLLLVALLPLQRWTEAQVYPFWYAAMVVCTLAALIMLSTLWPARDRVKRLIILAISPIAFLGPFLGQVDALLLLSNMAALWMVRRQKYMTAGAILMAGLVKPQIGAGAVLLLAAMSYRRRHLAQYLAGVALGSATFLGLSMLFMGPDILLQWVHSLFAFGRNTVHVQVNISSLTTLYIDWAPDALGPISILAPLAWLAWSLHELARIESPEGEHRWLLLGLVGWLLVTPYAHPHDDVVLLPAIWWTWQHHGTDFTSRALVVGLWLSLWLCPFPYVKALAELPQLPMRGYGIVPVIVLAAVLWRVRITPLASAKVAIGRAA